MPSDFDNDLLREAIMHIKASEFEMARNYLERALEVADDNTTRMQVNYYLAMITNDPHQKRNYLEETLAIDPTHADARKALAILDGKLKADEIVDADHLSAQSTQTQNARAERFTCPKCGSRMVFAPDGRSLVCELCRRQQILGPDASANEQDFILAMANGQGQRKPVAMKTFICQGCGANFLLPPQMISETCAYCGSVYVLAGTRELISPDSIIPMAFDQHGAALRLVGWMEQHKITPSGKLQPPRGLYLPVWTFDIVGSVPWSGTLYRDKHVVPVSGVQSVLFNDLAVYGTSKLADLLPHIIKDFQWTRAPAYDPRYLAGWPAEIYEVKMADASLDARKQAVSNIRATIYDQEAGVQNLYYSTSGLSVMSFRLVLISVWVTEYTIDGNAYRVIINGQSGSVFGETLSHGILGWLDGVLGG